MSQVSVRFGQVVRESRAARRLSQEALADLSGLSRSYLSEVERGTVAPSIETLQKLADALGEKLSFLVELYENRPPGK